MAADNGAQGVEDQKLHVGKFTYIVSKEHLAGITDKIGNILEAQVILRGEKSLGYGYCNITTRDAAGATDGDIIGDATVRQRAPKAARGTAKTRGTRAAKGGRVRKSADDVEGDGVEASAANGQSTVGAITEGVKNLLGAGEKKPRAGKNGTTRAPRPKRERGEPSKTLVFIRNLPYSYTETEVSSLFSEAKLSYQSVSIPVWKYGIHKGKGRGYAFATVDSEDTQKKVIEALNGKEITSTQAPSATAAAATEGAEAAAPAGPRTFRLAVRQGYENDLNEASADEAAPTGNDSGTAENQAVTAAA